MQKSLLAIGLIGVVFSAGCAAVPERSAKSNLMFNEKYAGSLDFATEKNAAQSPLVLQDWQDRPWWEYYGDEQLNHLITIAVARSPNLAQAKSQLAQAAAAARQEFADLLPSASLSGSRATSRGEGRDASSFSLRGAASYELDLWGGNRAAYKADKFSALAAAQEVQTAQITLSAALVESWLQLLALREEEALLHKQVETNRMILDLQHKRYASGAARALDVLQQTEVLERTKAQLPDIRAEQEVLLHRIAILAGLNPSSPPKFDAQQLPAVTPVPKAGVPAGLLASRPDIRAAWLRLRSADWALEAARVDRLPSFDIGADYMTTATRVGDLFNAWVLDLALNLALPIIDGGARAAEQARQRALADERFQNYRETVLTAIGEVEDALSRHYHQAEKISALQKQMKVSRNALEQATISYGNGDTDYIAVLNSLNSTQSLEQQLVRARRDLALYRVDLYRSLGLPVEGWDEAQRGALEKTENGHD